MFKKLLIIFFCFCYVNHFAQIERLLEGAENKKALLKVVLYKQVFDNYVDTLKYDSLKTSNSYINPSTETFINCLVYYVINPNPNIDSKTKYYPLLVDKTTQKKPNPITGEPGGLPQIVTLFTFMQLQSNPNLFKKFSGILKNENEKGNVGSHNISSSKIPDENNLDQTENYFNYQKLNDYYSYKLVKPLISTKFSLSKKTGSNVSDDYNWHLDVSFSRIGISFEKFYESVKNMSVGFELSSHENILNILPFQSSSLIAGGRLLLPLEGLEKDANGNEVITNNTKVLDFRILVRFGANTNRLYGSPILNLGPNVGVDIKVSNFFGLFPLHANAFFWPKENYNNHPITKIGNNSYNAFFSFYQAQFLSTFFKNLSSNGNHMIKVDLGIAYYDVIKASYSLDNTLLSIKEMSAIWQPVLELEYNLVQMKSNGRKEPILGISSRIFEQRVKLGFWLSLLNFADLDNDDLRFEITYITEPFFRNHLEWENPSGTFLQLRWRHGFYL
ncbi:MAG: hypothetical protein WC879_09885 [Melioribacteraceae bacterium]